MPCVSGLDTRSSDVRATCMADQQAPSPPPWRHMPKPPPSPTTVGNVRVPDLPAEMRRRIVDAWGEEVQGWLEAVPLIAARRARVWNLELDATIVKGFDSWVMTCSDDRG